MRHAYQKGKFCKHSDFKKITNPKESYQTWRLYRFYLSTKIFQKVLNNDAVYLCFCKKAHVIMKGKQWIMNFVLMVNLCSEAQMISPFSPFLRVYQVGTGASRRVWMGILEGFFLCTNTLSTVSCLFCFHSLKNKKSIHTPLNPYLPRRKHRFGFMAVRPRAEWPVWVAVVTVIIIVVVASSFLSLSLCCRPKQNSYPPGMDG